MTVSAIVTSHDNYGGMVATIRMLHAQRHAPAHIIALYSTNGIDPYDTADLPPAQYLEQPDYADWGHQKRAKGLELATGDYVAFFNDDDIYSSKYLQKLAATAQETNADIVACDFVSHLAPGQINLAEPVIGRITSGNFIVRTRLAKKVGYNHRDYPADGQFIEDLMAAGASFARVPEVLYVHS